MYSLPHMVIRACSDFYFCFHYPGMTR